MSENATNQELVRHDQNHSEPAGARSDSDWGQINTRKFRFRRAMNWWCAGVRIGIKRTSASRLLRRDFCFIGFGGLLDVDFENQFAEAGVVKGHDEIAVCDEDGGRII